jgi:type VI secretion system secreted protein VgrG
MGDFSQEGRTFRVDTPLGTDVLLLQRLQGDEGVSTPFHYTLELLSEDDGIDAASLLRQAVAVTVTLPDGSERTIHGLVRRFIQLGQQEDLTAYRAEVVPWLWFLTLSQDCKIFQNKSVPDILQEVFDGLGYADYEIRCSASYAPREYCVQYRESHFNFVSRLMEEEGIFYFFEHTADKHLLVLGDMPTTFADCPGQSRARMATEEGPWQDEDVVTELTLETAVHLGKVTLRDYDFTRPSLNLETAASGADSEEVYAYPGGYLELSDGERYAALLLEEGECPGRVVHGRGNCRAFQSGYKFELTEHYRPDANGRYLITSVSHRAEAGDYRSWDTASVEYTNTFVCIPASTPFRPPRRSRRPRMQGSQTAVVVGPSGEEVYTDEYGRVKVQFHWDRLGVMDQNSSCWLRVAFPWAGKGYGSVSIPRIGNEVVVDFLEGDPDRPLITGCVYNAEQPVPFDLPGSRIQMGMKSRSSPGGGGYNEITMTDTKGEEKVNVHAQFDMTTTVEHDQTDTINNNRTTSVAVDDKESVGSNQSIDVGADQNVTVGGDQNVSVTGDQNVSVTGDQNVSVTGDQNVSVTGTRNVSVSADENISVSGSRAADIGVNDSVKVGVNITLDAGVEFGAKGGASAKVEAPTIMVTGSVVQVGDGVITIKGQAITLSAGGSSIAITPGGITMSGPMITSAASGMNKVMGGVVMIN